MELPVEIWLNIIEFHDEFNIYQVSKFFNDIFITMSINVDNISIYNEYRENYYVLHFKNMKINIYNLDILLYFTNVNDFGLKSSKSDRTSPIQLKKLTLSHPYTTWARNDTNINDFIIKYVPLDIKELSIYKDTTDINWELLTRFKELTHLYVNSSMFYKVHDDDPDDEEVSVEYEYVDGSLSQSVDKLVRLFKDTKLYYLYMGNYDHDCILSFYFCLFAEQKDN